MKLSKTSWIMSCLVFFWIPLSAQVELDEGFETTPIGSIPTGWSIGNLGVSIGVTDADAFAGAQSVRVVGRAFGGADVFTPVTTIADKVRVRFYLKTESSTWTSGNGKADITLRQRGRRASGGILKRNGQFFYQDDQTRDTTTVPAIVDEWVEVEFEMDFVNEQAKSFFNGVLTFTSPLTVDPGFDFLDINSGNASLFGNVSALYDEITVEEVQGNVVLLATNSAWIKQSADILSGSVIVNDNSIGPTLVNGFELAIGIGTTTPLGFEVKADSIKLKLGSNIGGDIFYNELINNGTILGSEQTPLDLPAFSGLPPFETGPAGVLDIVVNRNEAITLDPGDYGDIIVKRGGSILFTGGIYNVQSIDSRDATTLAFASSARVRIADRFATGQNSFVGPAAGSNISAANIIFFVAGLNGSTGKLGATPKAVKVGLNNEVLANLYAPDGTLWIKQGSIATGTFIARDIIIGETVQIELKTAFAN